MSNENEFVASVNRLETLIDSNQQELKREVESLIDRRFSSLKEEVNKLKCAQSALDQINNLMALWDDRRELTDLPNRIRTILEGVTANNNQQSHHLDESEVGDNVTVGQPVNLSGNESGTEGHVNGLDTNVPPPSTVNDLNSSTSDNEQVNYLSTIEPIPPSVYSSKDVPTSSSIIDTNIKTEVVKSVPLGPVCNCPSPHPHVDMHQEVKVEVKQEVEESPTLNQPKNRKQKRTATTSSEVSTPVLKKRSKRTREPSPLDRTESVEGMEGGGEQQSDETELAEEDQGGHYKIETVKLKCTEDGCEDEVADRDELHDHLRVIHHISPYRCLAEGCNERFEKCGQLGRHVRDNHSNISTWSCPHCRKTFKSQTLLSNHLQFYHFKGQFKCGYDSCHNDRVATLRSEILSHQLSVHRKTTTPTIFTCQYNNCGKSFNQKSNFISHQRIHQNFKPFKCTWNQCRYAATQQSNVIRHIRFQHFHLPATEKKQRELGIEDNREPRDYLLKELNN